MFSLSWLSVELSPFTSPSGKVDHIESSLLQKRYGLHVDTSIWYMYESDIIDYSLLFQGNKMPQAQNTYGAFLCFWTVCP